MIGKKILNYEIKSLLGEGGMGNVYLGVHAQLGRKVAVKMLHPKLASNSALRERFKNEASAMAHLQHPNIVALYDYMENDDGLFLIMEYVEGQELDHYIKNVTGPIGEAEIEKIMIQTLGAFDYAHSKGIVHRDIKPSNILLTKEGEVKVLDFGIAKLLDADKTLTKTGTQMGTVLYMSPEQVKGEKVDQRSDIYALGVTLFQMATGQAPYRSDTTEFEIYNQIVKDPLPKASTIYPGATDKIDAIIAKATAKDLKKRYQSCSEFLTDLEGKVQVVPKTTTVKSSPNKVEPIEKPVQTNNTETFEPKKSGAGKKALIVVLLIAVLGGGYFVVDRFILNPNEGGESTAESAGSEENYVYVLSGELNFRSDKNVDASIIEALPFGEQIELIGNAESPVYEDDLKLVWQKAKWEGKSGWIAKTIDDQDVVGDLDTYEDFNSLFLSDYDQEAGYGEMKVWAYISLIEYMKEKDWFEYYTIRNDSEEVREKGLKTVLRFRQNLNDKDKDDPYDFIVLIESEEDKKAVYIRAEDDNSGYVAGSVDLPEHVNYFVKKRKGAEVFSSGYSGINLIELDRTALGTADFDGATSGWFSTSSNELNWDEERFVESPYALTILGNFPEGKEFVSENEHFDFVRNGYTNSSVYWSVSVSGEDYNFYATQYARAGFGMRANMQEYSEWKETRYVTKNLDKMKLIIDVDEQQLLLYIRDGSGNSITWYGCIDKYYIGEFINYRNGYTEEYGC